MNSTALAIMQADELETIQRTGKLLAASGYFDAKGDSPQAIAMMATKIMAGRELGFGPFASVNGIHIIQGKPTIGANLMAAAVKGSGRYDYHVLELSADVCRIEFFQNYRDEWKSIGVSEFTKEDARKAGTKNMDKFPKNMLFARAMSNGLRFYTPDVFSGNAVYVPEELGADVDGEGNVVDTAYTVTQLHTNANGRQVDTATGEITGPEAKADNPFSDSTPYYVRDWNQLTGKAYDLVKWTAALHKASDRPATSKQYQYLTGIVDALTGKQHNYALSVLCQTQVDSTNMPGAKVAAALLEVLAETRLVDGEKVANPKYRADIAELVSTLAPQPVAA